MNVYILLSFQLFSCFVFILLRRSFELDCRLMNKVCQRQIRRSRSPVCPMSSQLGAGGAPNAIPKQNARPRHLPAAIKRGMRFCERYAFLIAILRFIAKWCTKITMKNRTPDSEEIVGKVVTHPIVNTKEVFGVHAEWVVPCGVPPQ